MPPGKASQRMSAYWLCETSQGQTMTASQSQASRASPAPDWLTPGHVRRILDPITFPGDMPSPAVVSPETTREETTS